MSSNRYDHDPSSTVRAYILVFLCLMLFTGLTVAAAFIDLGPFNNVVAIAIAVIKALMVAAIFMHLRGGAPMNKVWLSAGVFGFLLMVSFTLLDVLSRNYLGIPGK